LYAYHYCDVIGYRNKNPWCCGSLETRAITICGSGCGLVNTAAWEREWVNLYQKCSCGVPCPTTNEAAWSVVSLNPRIPSRISVDKHRNLILPLTTGLLKQKLDRRWLPQGGSSRHTRQCTVSPSSVPNPLA